MENWKIILTFTHPHEAHIAKSYIESEGIDTMIQDELTAQVNSFYSGAIGGVKMLVRESDFEKGVEILKNGGYINVDANETNIEYVTEDRSTDKRFCPFCKSQEIGKKKNADPLAALIYSVLGVFSPIFRKAYICHDCEKVWKFVKKQKGYDRQY
ncbi:MAG: hypothetical protein DRJ05_00005 [Bacteroidetes bacterium]|nr:MAG: hypothetical protein DRJ05_00005 [Bacteroidota bacterium]